MDLLVLLTLIPLLLALCIYLGVDSAGCALLYLGVPAAYLALRKRKPYAKVLFATAVLGLLWGMTYDLGVEYQRIWVIHYAGDLLSQHVIANTPLGDFLWAFLTPLYPIVFYEHFVDESSRRSSKLAAPAALVGLALFATVSLLMLNDAPVPQFPYAYAVLGWLMIVPALLGFAFRPRAWRVIVIASAYFFVYNLLGEIIWLHLGLGGYPGQYVGWLQLPYARLPVEEFISWTVFSTPTILLFYAWFFDASGAAK